MAITLSSVTSSVQGGGSVFTTQNVTKVVPSQSTDTFVFVTMNCNRTGALTYAGATMTYDGVTMTSLGSITNQQSGIGIWYIQNAAVGAGDIEANWGVDILYARMNAFYATGCNATDALQNIDSTTMTTETDEDSVTLTSTNTWTNSRVFGFDVSWVANRTYDMDFGNGETSMYAYSVTGEPDTGRVTKEQGSRKTSSGGTVSMTRTMDNISGSGNDVYLSFISFELRSADGAAVLDLSSNMAMTSGITLGQFRSYLSNIAMTPIFAKLKIYQKVFLENVAMTATILRDILVTFTSNIKLTSSINKLASKIFAQTMTMTTSFVKIFVTLMSLTSNIAITSNIRIIYNGIRVGIWSAVAKTTATFTKTAKKLATWNKEQKEI